MPMLQVQRNLPFSSISPSNRYPSHSTFCIPSTANSMENIMSNHGNSNSSISLNGNQHALSSSPLVPSSGLSMPSLQRRQSSNTAQIMDAYALDSTLPMLTAFPFNGGGMHAVNNSNINNSSIAAVPSSNPLAHPSLMTSTSGSFTSPNTSAHGLYLSNSSENQNNGSTTTLSGLEYSDPRRQTSLDFSSNALPPSMPILQHSTSSLIYNHSFAAFPFSSSSNDSMLSPTKVPPMRHLSSDLLPHSSSFDMGSVPSLLNGSSYSGLEEYSQSSTTGSFGSEAPYPYAPTRSDSLSVPNTFYNGELSHEDSEMPPPLSPLSTVYSSPPRSALSTPANTGLSRPQNMISPPETSLNTSFPVNPDRSHKRSHEAIESDVNYSAKRKRSDLGLFPQKFDLDRSMFMKSEMNKKIKKEKLREDNKLDDTNLGLLDVKPPKEKLRHVSPAVKLRTPDESDGSNTTTVEQIYYPQPDQPKPHRIRLIRVVSPQDNSVNIYAHGADVGSVVERKSNISRLFGRFESPTEKLLMNVPGPHNHTVGQESNILTEKGMYRFLQTNKMKGQDNYKQWILNELIPRLRDRSPITSTSDAGRKSLSILSKHRTSPPLPASPSNSFGRTY